MKSPLFAEKGGIIMSFKSKVKNVIARYSKVEIYLTQVGETSLLAGRNAVITGGTSGIGLAIADAIVKAGARVLLIGRNENKLNKVLSARAKDKYCGMILDISKCEDFAELPQKLTKIMGADIDILVNAAGVRWPNSQLDFLCVDGWTWDYILNTNLKGMYFLSQAFIREWLKKPIRKHRHIVNICSTEGMHGVVTPYGISKWGTIGLTQGIAKKYAFSGIIVNGIAPGGTATAMLDFKKGSNLQWPVASNRVSLPEEIGELAVFLCSDMGDNMVGSVVVYDGGESLH